MESWREAHIQVARRPFSWRCARARFRRYDGDFLAKWGSWMEALWSGELLPATPAQERFVLATRDKVPCRTYSQDLWRRYLIHSGLAQFTIPSEYLPKNRAPSTEYSAASEQDRLEGSPIEPDSDWDDEDAEGMDQDEWNFAMEEGYWPDGDDEDSDLGDGEEDEHMESDDPVDDDD